MIVRSSGYIVWGTVGLLGASAGSAAGRRRL